MDIRDIENIYPLSPVQETILAQSLEMENGATSWRQLVCDLRGALDIDAFASAWQHVAQQNPALRTSFYWKRLDKPVQVVHKQVDFPLEWHDWSGLSNVEQNARVESLLCAERDRSVDLTKAPLIRLTLYCAAEDVHQLVCSYHRLLLDRRSLEAVLKEVFLLYERVMQGQSLETEKRQPFSHYLAWLKRQDIARAETFWREMLEGFTTPTPLVFGHSPRNTHNSAQQELCQQLRLSSTTTQALQWLMSQHGLNVQTLLLGAWALLLNRYCRESEVVFGVNVSGRPCDLDGADSILGVFAQTLPMRVRLPPERQVLSWLEELQEQQLSFCQYSYCSSTQVHAWGDLPGDAPLFESQLMMEHSQVSGEFDHTGSLRVCNVRCYGETSHDAD